MWAASVRTIIAILLGANCKQSAIQGGARGLTRAACAEYHIELVHSLLDVLVGFFCKAGGALANALLGVAIAVWAVGAAGFCGIVVDQLFGSLSLGRWDEDRSILSLLKSFTNSRIIYNIYLHAHLFSCY